MFCHEYKRQAVIVVIVRWWSSYHINRCLLLRKNHELFPFYMGAHNHKHMSADIDEDSVGTRSLNYNQTSPKTNPRKHGSRFIACLKSSLHWSSDNIALDESVLFWSQTYIMVTKENKAKKDLNGIKRKYFALSLQWMMRYWDLAINLFVKIFF
jgi:hypothetical protein